MINRRNVIRALADATAVVGATAITGNPASGIAAGETVDKLIQNIPDDWLGGSIQSLVHQDRGYIARPRPSYGNAKHVGNAMLYRDAKQSLNLHDWEQNSLSYGDRATIGIDVLTRPGIDMNLVRSRIMHKSMQGRPGLSHQVY